MKRLLIPLAISVALLGAPSAISQQPSEERSPNVSHISNFNDDGQYGAGSDIAFWDDVAIAGNYSRPGGFRVLDISDPSALRELGQFDCPGTQADVSIWKDLVFVSVDGPRVAPECGAGAANAAQVAAGGGWEGIRVVSIANPSQPRQEAFVRTDCGSHTHTLLPDFSNKRQPRLIIYISSYPLTGHHPRHEEETNCGAEPAGHQKISVVEVPLKDPSQARVVAEPYVGPTTIGCHDVTVFIPLEMAAAACITESQIWDISTPTNPVILSRIHNPNINIHHSSAWSWDGDTVVLGDELGGALATPGCTSGSDIPVGALWFYDVSNPRAPELKGSWRVPRAYDSALCTAHNFNVVPLRSGKDILVSAWYNAGTTVVDFTDPSLPREIGWMTPTGGGRRAAAWSSHWYNGLIYANNFDQDVHSVLPGRGLDVFRISDPSLRHAVNLPRLNPQTQEGFPGRR